MTVFDLPKDDCFSSNEDSNALSSYSECLTGQTCSRPKLNFLKLAVPLGIFPRSSEEFLSIQLSNVAPGYIFRSNDAKLCTIISCSFKVSLESFDVEARGAISGALVSEGTYSSAVSDVRALTD